jgi:hypothetical protein
MYNSLDKQSVKQNTPIVAIGGCGQVFSFHTYININSDIYQLLSVSHNKYCESHPNRGRPQFLAHWGLLSARAVFAHPCYFIYYAIIGFAAMIQ